MIDTTVDNKGSERLYDTACGGGRAASSKATVKNALNASQRLKATNSTKFEDVASSENQLDRLDGVDGAGAALDGGSHLLSWSCRSCTFLNPDCMNTCLQCTSPKPVLDISSIACAKEDSNKKLWNEMKILKISDEASNFRSSLIESTSSDICPVSRIGTTTNSAATNAYPEGASKVINPAQPKNCNVNEPKWSCSLCTYDNWPRSVKCIMCGTSHSETENEAIPIGSGFPGSYCFKNLDLKCVRHTFSF